MMKVFKKEALRLLFSLLAVSLLFSCKQPATMLKGNYTEVELYRPNFHFTPEKGWMNDPNGMFYYNGYYHLFFQYFPEGNIWGPMHWGHAISTDMISWTEKTIALYPDEKGYIFSGSAVVDINNTSGFGTLKNPPIIAMFTYHDMKKEKAGETKYQSQAIAYSLDEGMTWTKYEANPVIENPNIKDFRDPKMTWDSIHKQWLMVLAAGDKTMFYTSKNLKEWILQSDFGADIGAHGGVWECPDFFPLKIEGSDEYKWVLLLSINPGGPNGGSATQYFVGDFDGKKFKLVKSFTDDIKGDKGVWIDYGRDNYAGVTFSNISEVDGRKLFVGWMSNWDYAQKVPTETWRSSMTIPRELTLVKEKGHFSVSSRPAKELQNYVVKTSKEKSIKGTGKLTIATAGKIDLTKAIINFNMKNLKQDTYTFSLSNGIGESLSFGINNTDNYLFLDRSKSGKIDFSEKFAATITKASLNGNQKEATFKIILDKTSIEIFYNNGEKVITEIFFPNQPLTTLSVSSNEKIEIKNLEIDQLYIN